MKVLTIILGVLLTIFGIVCCFSPGETFLATGYVLAILLLVFGIIGIVNVIRKVSSPITLFANIPAVIIGGLALFRPGSEGAFDALILILFAAWLLVEGIVSIVVSIRSRFFNPVWVLGLIFGILSIIIGGYSFAHPAIAAVAIGILVGIYLIEIGISMITLAATARNIEDAVEEVDQRVQNFERKMAAGANGATVDGQATEVSNDDTNSENQA